MNYGQVEEGREKEVRGVVYIKPIWTLSESPVVVEGALPGVRLDPLETTIPPGSSVR